VFPPIFCKILFRIAPNAGTFLRKRP